MITVNDAEKIILQYTGNFGEEMIHISEANGRVLAENIIADRDMPPFNRATMDGIGLNFEDFKSISSFKVIGLQAAGDSFIFINSGQCIEIMTGAALDDSINIVIPYEEVIIENEIATVSNTAYKRWQNVHKQGVDKNKGELLCKYNSIIDATVIGILASVGKKNILVKRLPKVAIISSGNELVNIDEEPNTFQIRKSNNYSIESVLKQRGIQPSNFHLTDDLTHIIEKLEDIILHYDVIIISGGVSMGKLDYMPSAFKHLRVKELFYKVSQRPGKPFFFGIFENGCKVFALPGNPVSTFLCLHRYFVPWLQSSLGSNISTTHAKLEKTIVFPHILTYFMPVSLFINTNAVLVAIPLEGNGSGDFSNLINAQAFMEFPAEENTFTAGGFYKVWIYKDFLTSQF